MDAICLPTDQFVRPLPGVHLPHQVRHGLRSRLPAPQTVVIAAVFVAFIVAGRILLEAPEIRLPSFAVAGGLRAANGGAPDEEPGAPG